MRADTKTMFTHYLSDTNILLENVRAKYGKDHIFYKLLEDLQEEVIDDMRNKLHRLSPEDAKDYFLRAKDLVTDVIVDSKL